MTDAPRTLSDGSKPPALPRWFVWVMLALVLALGSAIAWIIGSVFGFGYFISH
jgi:hypothetical protein